MNTKCSQHPIRQTPPRQGGSGKTGDVVIGNVVRRSCPQPNRSSRIRSRVRSHDSLHSIHHIRVRSHSHKDGIHHIHIRRMCTKDLHWDQQRDQQQVQQQVQNQQTSSCGPSIPGHHSIHHDIRVR